MSTLSPQDIRKALGLPPDDSVERVVHETIATLSDKLNRQLHVPEIRYDLKGTTAGKANSTTIWVNNDLLYTSHKEDMLTQTIPHEVAHCVQRQLYPQSQPHGYEWQYLMRLLGLAPDRCHSYTEIKKARNRTKMDRPFVYECSCQEHKMTQITHRRVQQGRSYTCTDCGTLLRFKGICKRRVEDA